MKEIDCMVKFFEIVEPITKFKEERFKCALGVS